MSKNFKLWRASTTILDKACTEIYKIKQTRFFYWFFFSWFLQYFFKKTLKRGFRLTSWVFTIKSNSIWSAPVVFPKICLLKKGLSPAFLRFFCNFLYYHKSHLSWKFHWNFPSRSEDMKIFSVNIICFHQFFGFFDISLLQRNYWRQHIANEVSIILLSTWST